MNWYYVDQGQQAGPVDEAQLEQLRLSGKIQPETLVWREGMANWMAFKDAGIQSATSPGSIPSAPGAAASNQVRCAQCGGMFPPENTIRYGTVNVCAACKPIFLQKLAEGAQINTAELNYAGFWIRFVAKFVDGLVLGIPFVAIFAVVIGFSVRGNRSEEPAIVFLQLFLQLGFLVVQVAYQTFFLGKYGATLGKMACGLKVVTGDNAPISYGRAIGRAFAEILSGMVCYIGYIIAGFDSQKRALHDHICNTRVIYKNK
jgi:uncharacterized RDD family membrane protein YckC